MIFHPASSREHKDFGFMQAYLSFKPHLAADRQRFGPLITIDDGTLEPDAKGFGLHPHRDVEVVTFLVEGKVEHIDPNAPDHSGTMRAKAIQAITAGTGIVHNEVNASSTDPMRALQIWFEPHALDLTPDYSRKQLDAADYLNRLQLIMSPSGEGASLIAQQDARLSYGLFDKDMSFTFRTAGQGRSVYVFAIDGSGEIDGKILSKGDAVGFLEIQDVPIVAQPGFEVLIFELPSLTN